MNYFSRIFTLVAVVVLVGIILLTNLIFENKYSTQVSKTEIGKTLANVFSRKVSVSIPQCRCTKLVPRPYNAVLFPIGENEITCSKENLVLGAHQRVIAYTYFVDAYHDPQSRNYFDGVE